MGIKQDRVNRTIKLIKESQSLSIRQLAEILNVSIMTIRRDIDEIVKDPDIQMIRWHVSLQPTEGDE